MSETKNPPDYASGLGETVRGYRLMLGLSKDGMAREIGIAERSYERVEDERRPCPAGFIDTLDKLVDRFEDDVDTLIEGSVERVVEVSDTIEGEWFRNVAGRAAVLSGTITPTRVSNVREMKAG